MNKPDKLDPLGQLSMSLEAFDIAINEANSIRLRMNWIKSKVVAELEQIRDEREKLELYDEPAAATILKIEPNHLGDLRRRLGLPHINFGNKIRYTKRHLSEIISLLEIKQPDRTSRKAA